MGIFMVAQANSKRVKIQDETDVNYLSKATWPF